MKQISLNGVLTYPFKDKTELLNFISDKKQILIAVNAEKIINKNDKLVSIINENNGYPDGIGAVWALRRKGFDTVKIPGVELWLDIINEYYRSKSFYLIGSSSEVIGMTVQKLMSDFPSIDIRNYHNGFFSDEDQRGILTDIKEVKPDIIFVAMGTPRQEYFMDELLQEYPALYVGLGGSFDVYSGKVKRAPVIFQNRFEWMYRLFKEPTRLKRQMVLLRFFILLVLKKI